jgi:alanyl-tRNA synthetase
MPVRYQRRPLGLSRFLRQNDHGRAVGAVVPRHDPTLMFTNAGMVPFRTCSRAEKPKSLRAARREMRARRQQAYDLDNVGYTARHRTFEMLGTSWRLLRGADPVAGAADERFRSIRAP